MAHFPLRASARPLSQNHFVNNYGSLLRHFLWTTFNISICFSTHFLYFNFRRTPGCNKVWLQFLFNGALRILLPHE